MKAVGVKVLKTKLSEYLREVKLGEVILVTERDQVIAELRPVSYQKIGNLSLEDQLSIHAEKGEITLRSDDSKDWPHLKALSFQLDISSTDILNELRGDSR